MLKALKLRNRKYTTNTYSIFFNESDNIMAYSKKDAFLRHR